MMENNILPTLYKGKSNNTKKVGGIGGVLCLVTIVTNMKMSCNLQICLYFT